MENAKSVLSSLLDWIYPPSCLLCEELLPPGGREAVCPVCEELLVPIRQACAQCGLPSEMPLCLRCSQRASLETYRQNFALYTYESAVREMILRFKYRGSAGYGAELGRRMARGLNPRAFEGVDLLVPVPVHPRRERQRGYNQAALLARGMAEALRIPSAPRLLARTRYTAPLSGMGQEKRLESTKSVFAVRPAYRRTVAGKTVLLVDDIYTTGATLASCASALLSAGARLVKSATLAVTPPHGEDGAPDF